MNFEISAYIILAVVVGFLLGIFTQWGLHRRTLRLEMRQADLETEVLSEKRKRAINTRWKGLEQDTEMLKALANRELQQPTRYANDPQDGYSR